MSGKFASQVPLAQYYLSLLSALYLTDTQMSVEPQRVLESTQEGLTRTLLLRLSNQKATLIAECPGAKHGELLIQDSEGCGKGNSELELGKNKQQSKQPKKPHSP